jgi:hypothetical protein
LHHRKPGTRASGAAALDEAVNEEAMLADAGKSNRKYDGAYFLLSRAGWARLDNLCPRGRQPRANSLATLPQ